MEAEDEVKEALLPRSELCERPDCPSDRPRCPPRRHTVLPFVLKTMYFLAFLSALPLLARALSSRDEGGDALYPTDTQGDVQLPGAYTGYNGYHGGKGRKGKKDPYGGKTLAPSNVTVITGLFRQDDPDLKEDGYDMLKDGFGLLDKSPDRWKKFTR